MTFEKALEVQATAKKQNPDDKFTINRIGFETWEVEKITVEPSISNKDLLYCHVCKGIRLIKSFVCCDCKTTQNEMDRRKHERRDYVQT